MQNGVYNNVTVSCCIITKCSMLQSRETFSNTKFYTNHIRNSSRQQLLSYYLTSAFVVAILAISRRHHIVFSAQNYKIHVYIQLQSLFMNILQLINLYQASSHRQFAQLYVLATQVQSCDAANIHHRHT